MFKVGEFSRLNGITVKTLHHYDRIGLLKPAHVDQLTNYRFYTIAQIDKLNRILALKDLGLSLEEIQHLFSVDLSLEEMNGILKLKKSELEKKIIDIQARLKRIETRLDRLIDGNIPDHEIVVRQVETQSVLSLRQLLPLQTDVPHLFQKVLSAIQAAQLRTEGAWIALYHHQDYRERDLDVEICVPMQQPESFTLDIQACQASMKQLDGIMVATTLCHFRVPEDILEANQRVYRWIIDNNYEIAPYAGREVYPIQASDNKVIPLEIQLPILKK
ncbi:MAG: MerR family transcriptional regulator [Crocinitomicaceae bacterium]